MRNRKIIPLVHQLGPSEVRAWKSALSLELSDYEIIEFDQLSSDQRDSAVVALVANPNPAQLKNLRGLKWVQSLWAGVERMVSQLRDTKLPIARMIDPELSRTMSEAVLTWTLYLQRDMDRYQRNQAHRCWQPLAYRSPGDTHVLILGLGELGRVSAQRLVANGYRVSGWSRSPKDVAGISCLSGKQSLFKEASSADILVNLLPLTPDTHGLINKDLLTQLPNGAKLINFGRGPSVDVDALLDALNNGSLEHAVLDVFETEPLAHTSPLWDHAKVSVLPHISAPTDTKTASKIAAANIRRYFESGILPQFISFDRGY